MNGSVFFPRPVEVEFKFVTSQPIVIADLLGEFNDPMAGAVVMFSGEVRNHNHGKQVNYLYYEAFAPLANRVIGDIVDAACEKWQLHNAICVHRTGKLGVGESAVVVITSSSHRKEAFAANQYIMERVKHEAPIWKKEYFTDGTSGWGQNCGCGKNHQYQEYE